MIAKLICLLSEHSVNRHLKWDSVNVGPITSECSRCGCNMVTLRPTSYADGVRLVAGMLTNMPYTSDAAWDIARSFPRPPEARHPEEASVKTPSPSADSEDIGEAHE